MDIPTMNVLQTLMREKGYAFASRSEFETIANANAIDNANAMALQHGSYSWLVYDPESEDDPCNVGDSPRQVCEVWFKNRADYL